MRAFVLVALVIALPAAHAVSKPATVQFEVASDFEDYMLFVSGEATFASPSVVDSIGFFRAQDLLITGLDRVCWQLPGGPECVGGTAVTEGAIALRVVEGSSFGFNAPVPFGASFSSAHALATFVDLSTTPGILQGGDVGPAAIVSLVEPKITVGPLPALPPGRTIGFTTLEEDSRVEVLGPTGTVVHTLGGDDPPLTLTGDLRIPQGFAADVVVLPFRADASAEFVPAVPAAAREGLAQERLDLLQEILDAAKFIGPVGKRQPFAILAKAGVLINELFNGAFIRTRLSDDPNSLGDVAFAKFDRLSVRGEGNGGLEFDGSFSLVVGDFGSGSAGAFAAVHGPPFPWWLWVLVAAAAFVLLVSFMRRSELATEPAPGPYRRVAVAGAVLGFALLIGLWDWQVNQTLGTSVLTTDARGGQLGLLVAVELGTLALALAVIGLPVYLLVRHGLRLARQPDFTVLAPASAFLVTLALGILVLPAFVGLLVGWAT